MTQELKRVMGLPGGIAAAVGLVVASTTLVAQGQGFGIAGPGFVLAMIAAMLINLFVAFSFAELAGLVPRAGSINHYTQAALGPFVAILAVICPYILASLVFVGSTESAIPGLIFRDVFASWMPPLLFSAILVVLLVAINLRGIVLFKWVQLFTVSVMIGSLSVLGIIGLFGLGSGEPVEGAFATFNPMGTQVFTLVALAFWLFVGIEFVTPLAEEIKKPRVYIPAAMIIGLVIVLISGLLYGLASIRFVPAEELAGSATPHVDAATAMLGRSGQIWLAIASILATATTVNTLLCAIPRMLYGMAKKGQAPSFLGRVNRFGAPDAAIVFCAALILVPLLFGIADAETIVTYILAGSLLWILSYIVAHVDLMILRWKHNSAPGAFRTPLYPIPQLLSIGGLVWMVFKIAPDPSMSQRIYTLAFVFLGASAVYAAAWVILKEKKGLFQTTPVSELAEGEGEGVAAFPEGVATAPADA